MILCLVSYPKKGKKRDDTMLTSSWGLSAPDMLLGSSIYQLDFGQWINMQNVPSSYECPV